MGRERPAFTYIIIFPGSVLRTARTRIVSKASKIVLRSVLIILGFLYYSHGKHFVQHSVNVVSHGLVFN